VPDVTKSLKEGRVETTCDWRKSKELDQLCAHGCDRATLIGLFEWLAAYKPLKVRTIVQKENGSQEQRTIELDLRQLDFRERAHAGFSLKHLRKIALSARRLQEDVAKLRKIPLVHMLVDREVIRDGDLLASSPLFPSDGGHFFKGLILLPEIAQLCGSQKRPDYTTARMRIHKYLFSKTCEWRDGLFAAMHNNLFPNDPEQDGKDVQRWRSRRGLLGPQQKTRRRKNAGCC